MTDSLAFAHPLVRDWFIERFNAPTAPQEQSWPVILAGENTLLCAPTGSGKTLAAFLVCIDHLVRRASAGTLPQETSVLYISPLKALSNDIQKNLTQPLEEISLLAKERGETLPEINIAVRTGDTLAKERARMLKKPPHILVTTPESFYILLTAEKSRKILSTVKTVIVDEIHAVLGDKRGTHLALSLERLEALCVQSPLRIGLSATQKPLATVAHFLNGGERKTPHIINLGHQKKLDIAIEIPKTPLSSVTSNEMWDELYDRLTTLANEHRSTLIFVNTRRLAERAAHHLRERLGEHQVAAHHGSLSRKLRLMVETQLKNGELKVLVATASLELGIDIGNIDLVCQIGSPRVISVALQRIGRAGHWHGAMPKGRIFATTRDELIECAALVMAIRAGTLDELKIPEQSIDILAQQIVAAAATNDWHIDDLFQLIKQAFPYRDLTRKTFDDVIEMLVNGVAGARGRYGAYLFYDRINQKIRARRGGRLIAITNGGAIPDNALFTVIAEADNLMVGTLDEDFAIESHRGDIILLGSTSWRIKRIEGKNGKVYVENAKGAPPTVPFWRGEAEARTQELSETVAKLRQKINDLLQGPSSDKTSASDWLKENCNLNAHAATQLINYILNGRAILGAVPTQETIIAERFFDASFGMQLIIHAPFGARINKAWGLALRKCFCRSFNFELQAAATDNGLIISLAEQHSFPLADVFQFLHPNTLKKNLIQAVLQSPLWTTRWRWNASRSLSLIRFRNGKKIPPQIVRMLADDLLAAVFPDAAACQDNIGGRDIELPDHPLVQETIKETLTHALDIDGLMQVLNQITQGTIKCIAIDTPLPSPFAHEILNAGAYAFLDDAPLEERRSRAVEMYQVLPTTALDMGALDLAAIQTVQDQIKPDIRDADELHDFLQTVIALPEEKNWQHFFRALNQTGRVGAARYNNTIFWFTAEKSKIFFRIFAGAILIKKMAEMTQKELTEEEALLHLLRGWLLYKGPITASALAKQYSLDEAAIEMALLKLEASGFVIRRPFNQSQTEWCERRILARIHRLTVQQLRKAIAPISHAIFSDWLLHWQHAFETQLRGKEGLMTLIEQLQGAEMPASIWEKEIFAKRTIDYSHDLLDMLCLKGQIGWGRLSFSNNKKSTKRIMATSHFPLTFFIREDAMCFSKKNDDAESLLLRTHAVSQKIYAYLQEKGASFFSDIKQATGHLNDEVEQGLWELVTIGLVTADSFDNLRALIDRKRRLRKKSRRHYSPHFSHTMAARWSLLQIPKADDETRIKIACKILLKRYGILFRDALIPEKNMPAWRELLPYLRRLEDRGELRGGHFIEGIAGEQFALPKALESLRGFYSHRIHSSVIPT